MAEKTLIEQYNEEAAKLVAQRAERDQLNAELDVLMQEAESLQKQADEKKAARIPLRVKREALSKDIEAREKLIGSLGVQQQILTDQQATAKAREEADKVLADAKAKAKVQEEEMDAKLKKADEELVKLQKAREEAEKPKE